MQNLKKITIDTAVNYKWGDNCDGWHLLQSDELTVIREKMPPGTAEQLHYHNKAQQLFYILSGEANFKIGDERITLSAGESLHINAGVSHFIANLSGNALEFLVISQPKSHGDRVNI